MTRDGRAGLSVSSGLARLHEFQEGGQALDFRIYEPECSEAQRLRLLITDSELVTVQALFIYLKRISIQPS